MIMKKRQSENRAATSADPNQGRTMQMIVEMPRACRNKYKYDEKTGRLRLSKVMPEGMVFPYEFGFIPGARAQDGDPLDVLVLTDEPTFPGCELDCRLKAVHDFLRFQIEDHHTGDSMDVASL